MLIIGGNFAFQDGILCTLSISFNDITDLFPVDNLPISSDNENYNRQTTSDFFCGQTSLFVRLTF